MALNKNLYTLFPNHPGRQVDLVSWDDNDQWRQAQEAAAQPQMTQVYTPPAKRPVDDSINQGYQATSAAIAKTRAMYPNQRNKDVPLAPGTHTTPGADPGAAPEQTDPTLTPTGAVVAPETLTGSEPDDAELRAIAKGQEGEQMDPAAELAQYRPSEVTQGAQGLRGPELDAYYKNARREGQLPQTASEKGLDIIPGAAPQLQNQALTALQASTPRPEVNNPLPYDPGTLDPKEIKANKRAQKEIDNTFKPNPDATKEENDVARAEWELDHPQNRDKGVKGFLRELAQNFFEGLSKAQPGMNVAQSLLLGGVGAGAGVANRSWNEQRQAQAQLPELRNRVAQQQQSAYNKARNADLTARPELRAKEIARKAESDKRAADLRQLTLDWKKDDRDKYYQLEQEKMDAAEARDERRYQQAERRQAEIERNNRVNNQIGQARVGVAQTNAGTAAAKAGPSAAKDFAAARASLLKSKADHPKDAAKIDKLIEDLDRQAAEFNASQKK